jgi:hypothetical protein
MRQNEILLIKLNEPDLIKIPATANTQERQDTVL